MRHQENPWNTVKHHENPWNPMDTCAHPTCVMSRFAPCGVSLSGSNKKAKHKTELSNSGTSRSPRKVSGFPFSQNPVLENNQGSLIRVSGLVLGFCAVTPRVEGRFAPCGPFWHPCDYYLDVTTIASWRAHCLTCHHQYDQRLDAPCLPKVHPGTLTRRVYADFCD